MTKNNPKLKKPTSFQDFFDTLVDDLKEVSYRNPTKYFFGWLAFSLSVVVIYAIAFLAGDSNLDNLITNSGFVVGISMMMVCSFSFGWAAVHQGIPAMEVQLQWVGLIAAIAWIGQIIIGAFGEIEAYNANQLRIYFDFHSIFSIAFIGLIPLMGLAVVIQRMASIKPYSTSLYACISSYCMSAFVFRIFYTRVFEGGESNLHLLIWILLPTLIATFLSWVILTPLFQLKTKSLL